ncbi:MAG: type II toxin-antitoxin system RelE/ParE family toxin [Burkholderiales bacterium]
MTSAKSNASARTFKTAWFAKEARKAKITDSALCKAIRQVMQGQADDLGGGVYKKRLNDNMHRSLVLAKAGRYWVYTYLYAKKDRENIEPDELAGFKQLAKYYAAKTEKEIAIELKNEDLLEICHDCED